MSKADKLKAIKGMNDVLPGHKDSFLDSDVWRLILEKGQAALEGYGFITPSVANLRTHCALSSGFGRHNRYRIERDVLV